MCGIAGWLGPAEARRDLVAEVQRLLRHRGPDSAGHHVVEGLGALIHTRLRVIDLSEAGRQPMSNHSGTIWVVFNGEIYNHRDLRRELESCGYVFRGNSDTEVIPHLYERYGDRFVEQLRGMFAIAVLDVPRNRLLLVRDRFGIKPLFYGATDHGLAFGSELRALRRIPGLDLEPDPQAVHDFVALHVVPAPSTIYRGIRAVEPGELIDAELRAGNVSWTRRQYHRWTLSIDTSLTLGKAADRAAELLDQAVGRQLGSDVPLGSLLSGGIDSSLISEAAQRAKGGGLRTFSVRFEEASFDETPAVLGVARRLGSDHLTLDFEAAEPSWNSVTAILNAAGQPFADTSILAVHQLCRLVQEHVTVALSGDGGDEGFGGYEDYRRLPLFSRVLALPSIVQRAAWSVASLASAPLARAGLIPRHLVRRMRDAAGATEAATLLADLGSWSRPDEMARLWAGPPVEPVARLFEPSWDHELPRGAGRLEQLSALQTEVDTRVRMANDFLPKVDIASMMNSLEIRVPMLDEDLFAFGLTLPHRLKVQSGVPKAVLREVASRRVPEVASLPKHGFGVPFDTWVDDQFRLRIREELLDGSRVGDFLDRSAYRPVVEAFCSGQQLPSMTRQALYQRVFMLMALEVSLRENS